MRVAHECAIHAKRNLDVLLATGIFAMTMKAGFAVHRSETKVASPILL